MTYWRKIYWASPDLPPKNTDVLVSVGGNMYVASLRIEPAYTTGRKKIVHHPEERYFVVSEYGWSCCNRDENISLDADELYWTELPKEPGAKTMCPCGRRERTESHGICLDCYFESKR